MNVQAKKSACRVRKRAGDTAVHSILVKAASDQVHPAFAANADAQLVDYQLKVAAEAEVAQAQCPRIGNPVSLIQAEGIS